VQNISRLFKIPNAQRLTKDFELSTLPLLRTQDFRLQTLNSSQHLIYEFCLVLWIAFAKIRVNQNLQAQPSAQSTPLKRITATKFKMVKPQLFSVLKRIIFIAFLIFLASYLQMYWAMGKLSNQTSSSCLDCTFAEDALMAAFITSLFLTIVFQILLKINNKTLKITIEFLLLAFVWLFWDYTVFVERESSWSTYLFKEELFYSVYNSVLPILVLSIITIFLVNYKYFKQKIGVKVSFLPLFFLFILPSCRNEKQPSIANKPAQKQAVKTPQTMAIPPSQGAKNKPTDFIPKGYVIHEYEGGSFTEGWDEIKGDLNKDGLADVVLIIKGTDKNKIIVDESRGRLDKNRRGIIVLFNKGDHYELAAKNYTCFSSENEDGGVYFAPELDVNIDKGNLYIDYGHGRYGSWSYTFKHQNGDMELIGYDSYSSRGPVPLQEISINFLTKKKLTRDNLNKNDDDQDQAKYQDTWEPYSIKKLIKLTEVKDFDQLRL